MLINKYFGMEMKMKKLNYREISKDNIWNITKLSKTLKPGQEKCVAENVYSIAQGSVNPNAYYRGIYHKDTPIGFFMLFIPDEASIKDPDEEDDFYLWRFMIAGDYQNKHYGSEVLNHIVNMGKELGYKELITSCQMGEVSPYKFYLKYGFIDTGKVDDGEQVLSFKIE